MKMLLFSIIRYLKNITIRKESGLKKRSPVAIQYPITYKCNSRCVMCGIWLINIDNDVSIEECKKYMNDPVFKKVVSVGINGGEPSIIKNIEGYVEEILILPALKSINIISNGMNKDELLRSLERIYEMCKKKHIKFNVSISLDGYGDIHDMVRGVKGAFEKTIETIDAIYKNIYKYCDSLELACTVVKQNIYYLNQLDEYVREKGIKINYRLAVKNIRVRNENMKDNYSIIDTPLEQDAAEYFHYLYYRSKSVIEKYKYYAIYYWLSATQKKRLLGCLWKERGVTLDSKGGLYYCAVASKEIGSLVNKAGKKILFDKKNIKYRGELVKNECDKCIHDYNGKIYYKNAIIFIRYILRQKYSMIYYRIRLVLGVY